MENYSIDRIKDTQSIRTGSKTPVTSAVVINDNHNSSDTGEKILNDVVSLLKKYLVLPDYSAEAFGLWILFTHTHDTWENSPRIIFTSVEAGSGKSTALKILELLCAGGNRFSYATSAFVRRIISENQDKPLTLLLDEADTFFKENPMLKPALNAGWERGAKAGTVALNADNRYVTESLALWAPVIMAGIGESWIWDAIRSRSLVFKLRKKLPSEKVEKWSGRDEPAARLLAERAARWAAENATTLSDMSPDLPHNLYNRERDNWRPLITIADAIGGEWPERARRIAQALSGSGTEIGAKILAAIREVFMAEQSDAITSTDLVAKLQKQGLREVDTPVALARMLKKFDIGPEQIKALGTKGYRRDRFSDAWTRYLPNNN